MSHSTNNHEDFCYVCNLCFGKKKDLYRHQSYDSIHKELLEKMFVSEDDWAITEPPANKTMEMMYSSDEDFIYPKPSTETKTETKTKENTKKYY